MEPTNAQRDESRVAILEVVDLLKAQLRERDAEIARLRQQLGQPEEDEQPPPPPPHKRTRSARVNTTLFRIVDSGAASGIAAYLATSDALRFARTAGRDFLALFSAEMETFDVGLARMRPFPSGERAAADAALAAVLRRSPRVAALGLGHRTHVSAATLRGVGCWPRLRVLGSATASASPRRTSSASSRAARGSRTSTCRPSRSTRATSTRSRLWRRRSARSA